jgi:tRNA(Ile)-lysidine synthase
VVQVVRRIRARVAAAVGDGRVVVACSGGPDSMVLADAAIAALGAPRVIIAHVDHGLRPDAGATAAAVMAWAATVGAVGEVAVVEVARQASVEAAARTARYAALRALAARHGAAAILTGHTARDQAETVLMRIVRGTGPAGLIGIPRRRGLLVRPLLDTTRAEILAYAAARALPVHDDPMNTDPRFARSRLRAVVMPVLAAENPAIERALGRLAAAAVDWRRAIDRQARRLMRRAATGPSTWAIAILAAAPDAVLARALDRLAHRAGLTLEATHARALIRMVRAPRAGTRTIHVPGGAVIRTYGALAFTPASAPSIAAPPPLTITGPDGPYAVRPWQPGDRMRPVRLRGRSRTVADLWGDAHVPRAARASARVVTRAADGAIVWAEHIGPAHGVEIAVVADGLPPRSSG